MAEPVRIIGHNRDSDTNEYIQAQVESDGSLRVQTSNLLDQYKPSDIDESGTTKYYGFVDKEAKWYIMEITSTTVRYVKGDSGYILAWTNRASQSYDYFYNTF